MNIRSIKARTVARMIDENLRKQIRSHIKMVKPPRGKTESDRIKVLGMVGKLTSAGLRIVNKRRKKVIAPVTVYVNYPDGFKPFPANGKVVTSEDVKRIEGEQQ